MGHLDSRAGVRDNADILHLHRKLDLEVALEREVAMFEMVVKLFHHGQRTIDRDEKNLGVRGQFFLELFVDRDIAQSVE